MDKLRTLLDWRTAMLAEHNEMLQLLSHEIRQPLNNASAAMQATMSAIADLQLAQTTPATKALLRSALTQDAVAQRRSEGEAQIALLRAMAHEAGLR